MLIGHGLTHWPLILISIIYFPTVSSEISYSFWHSFLIILISVSKAGTVSHKRYSYRKTPKYFSILKTETRQFYFLTAPVFSATLKQIASDVFPKY